MQMPPMPVQELTAFHNSISIKLITEREFLYTQLFYVYLFYKISLKNIGISKAVTDSSIKDQPLFVLSQGAQMSYYFFNIYKASPIFLFALSDSLKNVIKENKQSQMVIFFPLSDVTYLIYIHKTLQYSKSRQNSGILKNLGVAVLLQECFAQKGQNM